MDNTKFGRVAIPQKPPGKLGTSLFILGSLFNHSAEPNLKRIEWDKMLVVLAAKDVPKGGELFITYKVDEKEVKEQYGI